MKGFVYIADEVSGNIKDQIGFVDRVLQHGDNVFHIRGRSIVSSGLADALGIVRSQGLSLARWSIPNDATIAFVALGYQEAKGGGSRYWFDIQYKALLQELKALGFTVCCILPAFDHIDHKCMKGAISWERTACSIVDKAARSMKLDTLESPLLNNDLGFGSRAMKLAPEMSTIERLAEAVSRYLGPSSKRKRLKVMTRAPQKETQAAAGCLPPKQRVPVKNPFEGALTMRRSATRLTSRAKRQRVAVSEIPRIVTPKKEENVHIEAAAAPESVRLSSTGGTVGIKSKVPVIAKKGKPKRKASSRKRIFIS